MVVPVTGRVPDPASRARGRPTGVRAGAARTWTCAPARRSRTSRSTASSSARAPTAHRGPARGGRGRARHAGRADACARWSCPARMRSRRRPRTRASTRSSPSAGFEWRDAGCSMCLGMNPDILLPGERCASTSNRNFEGRQGQGGRTHLVSPQMAAAAAIAGHFVDIREWMRTPVRLDGAFTRVTRALVAPLDRVDVDTDQIIPKQFLKRIERTGFGAVPLLTTGAGSRGFALDRPELRRRDRSSSPGRNFGCGSSREHAPWALAGLRLPGDHRAVASPTSSATTAPRSACCRWRSPQDEVDDLIHLRHRQPRRHGRGRPRAAGRGDVEGHEIPFAIEPASASGCSTAGTTSPSRWPTRTRSRATSASASATARRRRPSADCASACSSAIVAAWPFSISATSRPRSTRP